MTHTERFEEFRARRDAERQANPKVTWRRVSKDTGGGWSGLGPNGKLVYVTEASTWGSKDGAFSYGWRDDKGLGHAVGFAFTVAEAKIKAAGLLQDGGKPKGGGLA